MKKKALAALLLTLLLTSSFLSFAQKRYGYAVLHFRCGDDDPQRDRVYYSPVIELNLLNFEEFAEGIDPKIPLYSVRYYNYALSKWFEMFLRKRYKIYVDTPDQYARKSKCIVFNEPHKALCDSNKLNAPCFFLNKEELEQKRKEEVRNNRSPDHTSSFCQVIDLEEDQKSHR